MKKNILAFICCVVMILGTTPIVYAQSVNHEEYLEAYEIYLERKAAGEEIYDLVDDNGNLWGYFLKDAEVSPTRYGASIDWTINSYSTVYGDNRYSLGPGCEIHVNIEQSRTGTSYLRFYNHDTNSYIRFTNTVTTNGWVGKIVVLGDGVDSSLYSFGIENASSNTIRYYGTYSL